MAMTPTMAMAPTAAGLLPADADSIPTPDPEVFFGRSAAMQRMRVTLERLGAAPIPVLITGESGTGKELVARLLHRQSHVAAGPFVKLNCPAIPATLLESELFGHEKGAFTGAHACKPGRVEQATGGTLFLDEIGELELGLQGKLLQLLQDRRFMRLGGREELRADARMLFATNRNLESEMAAGRLRQDLYYRINVVNLELPALRQRREDIPRLARYFVRLYSRHYGRSVAPLPAEFVAALQRYAWPGNVRELENMMKRYVVLGNAAELLPLLLARSALELEPDGEGSVSLKALTRRAVHELERGIILQALATHHWHRKRAAQALHISYRALLYKLKQAGLQSAPGAHAPAAGARAGAENDNPAAGAANPEWAEEKEGTQ
ncbi:MAG: sigma-54 interaction domain-containing protein [Terriglobales bacterium]